MTPQVYRHMARIQEERRLMRIITFTVTTVCAGFIVLLSMTNLGAL